MQGAGAEVPASEVPGRSAGMRGAGARVPACKVLSFKAPRQGRLHARCRRRGAGMRGAGAGEAACKVPGQGSRHVRGRGSVGHAVWGAGGALGVA